MEYGASLTYEDQIIDMEDPNFLVPKAAGGNNRSTTPLSQESTDSCHNNEAFEKGKIYLRQSHLYFFTNRNYNWKSWRILQPSAFDDKKIFRFLIKQNIKSLEEILLG